MTEDSIENNAFGRYCLEAMNGKHGKKAKSMVDEAFIKAVNAAKQCQLRYDYIRKNITEENERDMGPGVSYRFALMVMDGRSVDSFEEAIDAAIAKEMK